jgi:hypothetical protein
MSLPKLWQIYQLLGDDRPVQVVSLPTPDNQVFVRMIPGDPTSAKWVEAKILQPPKLDEYLRLPLYVQLAKVSGTGGFPRDMLRREHAWPADSNLSIEDWSRASGPDEITIYRVTRKAREPWRVPRWLSYGWHIEHQGTFEVTYQ